MTLYSPFKHFPLKPAKTARAIKMSSVKTCYLAVDSVLIQREKGTQNLYFWPRLRVAHEDYSKTNMCDTNIGRTCTVNTVTQHNIMILQQKKPYGLIRFKKILLYF